MLRLPNRCHNSSLVKALNIDSIYSQVGNRTASIIFSAFKSSNACQGLYSYLLGEYIHGAVIPGTSVDRVANHGINPLTCTLSRQRCVDRLADGVADSIRFLMFLDPFLCTTSSHIFNLVRCF